MVDQKLESRLSLAANVFAVGLVTAAALPAIPGATTRRMTTTCSTTDSKYKSVMEGQWGNKKFVVQMARVLNKKMSTDDIKKINEAYNNLADEGVQVS